MKAPGSKYHSFTAKHYFEFGYQHQGEPMPYMLPMPTGVIVITENKIANCLGNKVG